MEHLQSGDSGESGPLLRRDPIRTRRALSRLAVGGLAGVAVTCAALGVTASPAVSSAAVEKTSPVKARTVKLASQAPTAADWQAYLDGAQHASYNGSQTVITPTTAKALKRKWMSVPAPRTRQVRPSPTVPSSSALKRLVEQTGPAHRKMLTRVFLGHSAEADLSGARHYCHCHRRRQSR